MCGIAGVYRTQHPEDDGDVVRRMLAQLRLRGPDGEGMLRAGRLTLGHRRLAILDLSDSGRQPMRSHSGRYVVSFNGEIYNYRDLAAHLEPPPGGLRTTTDTEVLLLAWERWGVECLDRLVGQWAFALHDTVEDRLWLVRDRFGEKPLYYHCGSKSLVFASSIAALLHAPWVSREVDSDALAEHLALRYVVSPRTILKDVRKLPPGHLLTQCGESLDVRAWWAPRFREPAFADTARGRRDACEEFGQRFVRAAGRCTVSDVPVGLLLSDGIDSNGIRAAMECSGVQVPSFTYRAGTGGGHGDGGDARAGARNGNGRTINATYEEIAGSLVGAFSSMTEPVGDGAALATYLLIRAAREEATVFLCGHGGDEMLGGYRLSQECFRLRTMRWLSRLPLQNLDTMVDLFTAGPEEPAVRRRALARATRENWPAAARYLVQRPLPPEDLEALFAPRPVPGGYLMSVDRYYGECDPHALDLDRIQEVMLRTLLSENLLPIADAMAMASSAELRLPYLDRDLVDLVFQLPRSMRVSRWPGLANTKLILRWWARHKVPQEILQRRKRGFRFGNIRALLQSPRSQVRDLVMQSRPLRTRLAGLESWMNQPASGFRRGREAACWSLVAIAVWSDAVGAS